MIKEMTFDEYVKETFKPCPFCGAIPKVGVMEWEHGFVCRLTLSCCMEFEIECDDVIQVQTFNCEDEYHLIGLSPIDKWNRRVFGEKE